MASTTTELDTYVETIMVPTHRLTRFPGNARRGNVEELRKSLRRHGQYRALIVQDKGDGLLVILAGNHTYDGLVAEGRDEVRCEIHVMDDDLARRINIADNRQAELGTNDVDALLLQLEHFDGDFEGLGFVQDDIDAMLADVDIPDDAPEPAPKPAKPRPEPQPEPEEEPAEEEPTPAAPNRGLGTPVISYNLVFDNEVQQTDWYAFLRSLKGRYPDLETIGERLHAYLGSIA